MKILVLFLGLCAAGSLFAREEFLRQLPAEKFAAAGLNKLTPAELAHLEQLIAEHERRVRRRRRRKRRRAGRDGCARW
jgi:hypothetical protein